MARHIRDRFHVVHIRAGTTMVIESMHAQSQTACQRATSEVTDASIKNVPYLTCFACIALSARFERTK